MKPFISITILFLMVVIANEAYAQPSISGFTPASGPVGTSVTINGSGFSSTPTSNIVYFGPTKATVTAATSTQLTVNVPVGATYQPITVQTNGLTAYSRLAFATTYAGWGAINASTFVAKKDFATREYPNSVAVGDFDGDGKTDLAVANSVATNSSPVSILLNTSTGAGVASFAAKKDFATSSAPYCVSVGDLDGDGKPDLAVACGSSNTVSVLLNTSTGTGSVNFATKVDYATGAGPYSVAIGDFDGDGKPDLAVVNKTANTISVLRNTGTGTGSVSFAAKVDYTTGSGPYSVAIGDLDSDGKADMVVADNSNMAVSTFRNTSTGTGSISFTAKTDFGTGSGPRSVAIGDLDGDGKVDLAVGDYANSSVSILRNTSSGAGSVSFAAKVDFVDGARPDAIAIGDLDGDGKPDLVVSDYISNTIPVLRNTSTGPGSISYGSMVSYATGATPSSVTIGDFDGDGKGDIAATNLVSYTTSVYLHQADQVITFNVPSLNYGDSFTLNATTSSGLPLTYSGNNPSVAKINGNLLSVVGAGVFTITASQAGNANFRAGSVSQTITINATPKSVMDIWAFQYRYDGRRRMSAKRVPGADWVYMVYDDRDRLVLTQDGNQRLNNQWTFTKYDALNRPVSTGFYNYGSSVDQPTMQTNVNNYYGNLTSSQAWYESFSTATGNVHNYDNKSFPQVTDQTQYLTVTYYDDNTAIQSLWGSTYNYTTDNLASGSYTQLTTDFRNVTGHPVAGKIKLIDGSNTWLRNIMYYDDHYRVIQTITDNIKGGTDRVSNLYDFTGRVLTTKTTHHTSTHSDQFVARSFNYDHASRLLQTWHSVNGATPVLLTANDYNELGQLVTKKLYSTDGSTFKQNVDQRYNIRGWLTNINNSTLAADGITNSDTNDLFGMDLLYNQTDNGINNNSQYNGNISAVKWSNNLALGTVKNVAYKYGYDTLNRIKSSSYLTNPGTWTTSSNFAENGFSYDLNGNIRKLSRTNASGSSMDVLTYNYTGQGKKGNQLHSVTDAGDVLSGFVDGNISGDDYAYDVNGNMIIDKNKSITAITYNYLNLPQQVTKGTGEKIIYTYDAGGRKLKQQVYNASGTLTKTTDYDGEFIYQGDTLQFINHEEGRIVMKGVTGPEYQYHLKDHLGNVRLTFTTQPATQTFTAGFETTNQTTEASNFSNYQPTKINTITPTNQNANTGNSAYYLNGGYAGQVGIAKSLSVMPGDVVSIQAYAKYSTPSTTATNFTPFVSSLLAAFNLTAPAAGEVGTPAAGINAFGNWEIGAVGDESKNDAMKIFVTIVMFDRNYNFLDVAYQAVQGSGSMVATYTAKQPGYAYLYISNEHPYLTDVYFDDVTVTFTPSMVVQQEDFYPFGLSFNKYMRENSVPNNLKLFQGQEHVDDLGLNWDSFKWRNHQPDIGRFFNVDPLSEEYYYNSPYAFSENKVTAHIELEGLEAVPITQGELTATSDGQMGAGLVESVTDAAAGLWHAVTSPVETAVGIAQGINNIVTDPVGTGVSMATGIAASFQENPGKFMGKAVGDMLMTAATAGVAAEVKTVSSTENVVRVMSNSELATTKSTGLVRGGREGTHYVSTAVSNDAKRAAQRMALPVVPQVKATLQVPKGAFSQPTKVKPAFGKPGGGLERKGTGKIPTKIIKEEPMKNTTN